MKNLIIEPSISIKESLLRLEKVKEKCLIIANKKNELIGTLNDGDIRRAILDGANINSKIKKYVQKKNTFKESHFYLIELLLKKSNGLQTKEYIELEVLELKEKSLILMI